MAEYNNSSVTGSSCNYSKMKNTCRSNEPTINYPNNVNYWINTSNYEAPYKSNNIVPSFGVVGFNQVQGANQFIPTNLRNTGPESGCGRYPSLSGAYPGGFCFI